MISRRYESLFTAATLVAVAAVIGGSVALVAATRQAPPPPADAPEGTVARPLSLGQAEARKSYDAPPPMTVDPAKEYAAVLKTNQGDITVKLLAKDAPKTVNNFVFLAREGFYDGTIFHRVIDNFMIQGGDPTGTGMGGPGYRFADETRGNPNQFEPFTLAMANSGPDTNGSQFFITEGPTPHLDGKHTIFGRVTEGKDVVTKIESLPTGPRDKPLKDVVLESVQILVDGQAPATKPAE